MRKYSTAMWFLNDFVNVNLNGKIASKNSKGALRDRNVNKTTVLLRIRSNCVLGAPLEAELKPFRNVIPIEYLRKFVLLPC